jgi:hypothetical protein
MLVPTPLEGLLTYIVGGQARHVSKVTNVNDNIRLFICDVLSYPREIGQVYTWLNLAVRNY